MQVVINDTEMKMIIPDSWLPQLSILLRLFPLRFKPNCFCSIYETRHCWWFGNKLKLYGQLCQINGISKYTLNVYMCCVINSVVVCNRLSL